LGRKVSSSPSSRESGSEPLPEIKILCPRAVGRNSAWGVSYGTLSRFVSTCFIGEWDNFAPWEIDVTLRMEAFNDTCEPIARVCVYPILGL